ncbi:MAG TPA: hypothetical protein VIS74_07660 [Chthoniobacterales bacterium]
MPDRFDRMGMYRLIAQKIRRNPELLDIALANIERWLAKGQDQPHRLREWRDRIREAQADEAGLRALLELLQEDSERADYLRGFAPFAGILSTQERRPFIRECAYVH